MTKKGNDKKSQYYQTIARHFFKHRGAPFFLSSKELDLIARWENMRIPLGVILEGMRRSLQDSRLGQKKKGKILSLSYCDFQVLKAFEQFKDRKVGKGEIVKEREVKKTRAKAEIERFLEALPSHLVFLRGAYSRARTLLSKKDFEEEELECLEEEIEELLSEKAADQEKKRVRDEVCKEYATKNDEELASILKIKLVKFLREKYKIPYVSLFYY